MELTFTYQIPPFADFYFPSLITYHTFASETLKNIKMENSKNFGKIALGVAIILVGSLLILDNLGLSTLPWKHYLISWKTLLIVIGISMLVRGKNYSGGIILVTLGTVFWLPEFLNFQVTLKQILWPSLLIAVGAIVLFKPNFQRRNKQVFSTDHRKEGEVTILENPDSN